MPLPPLLRLGEVCLVQRPDGWVVARYRPMVAFEAVQGEFHWRVESGRDGFLLLLGDGRHYVQVGSARNEADLAKLLARVGLTVADLVEV